MQSAYHRWCRYRSVVNWDLFCQARGIANRLYAAAKARYSADCRRNLDDCASANAWWCTLKGHVFSVESYIPPLCSPCGALVSDPAVKAELLSGWFDSKQSRDIVELPQTCQRIGLHYVVIPKGLLSAVVCSCRPISITPVLSKIFERLISLRFGRFLERFGFLSSHHYSYRKSLGTCDALLDIVCAGQMELDRGGELALVQIYFRAVFDRVNHGGLVFKLREAEVGGMILKVFQNFLPSRTQRVKVDGV